MRKLVAATAAAIAITALPWSAVAESFPDANDTKGLMDLSSVESSGTEQPIWRFVTFKSFSAARIWDHGYGLVMLDTFGSERFDHYALIWSNGESLQGELFRDRRKKDDYRVSGLKVWRPNKSSMTIRVPLAKLDIPVERLFYRWIAKTLIVGRQCPRTCIDRVPDTGAVSVPVPITTPSPTPTETPSPTPSP